MITKNYFLNDKIFQDWLRGFIKFILMFNERLNLESKHDNIKT